MATQLAHKRGMIGLAGIGWLAELETFSVTMMGDPEDLEALEGTVGQLEPKGKRVEISGTVFIPESSAAYAKIVQYWDGFTRVECWAVFGKKFVAAYGRFNAPTITEDGTRLDFTFKGENPKIRNL